jgi:flagellar biosynthesis GTPase FlhF
MAIQSTPLIITGMHRSGLSLTASILKTCGVTFQQFEEPESSQNQEIEKPDFSSLQAEILRNQGINSQVWTSTKEPDINDTWVQKAQELELKYSDTEIWGWNDPNTALLLEFWAKILPEAKFLLIYRAPWEVVDSLYRSSEEIPFEKQPSLVFQSWINYNQKILQFYNKYQHRCLLSNIQTIVDHQSPYIQEINYKFDLKLGSPSPKVYDKSLLNTETSQNSYRLGLIDYYCPDVTQNYQELEGRSWHPNNNPDWSWQNLIKTKPSQDLVFQDWVDFRQQQVENHLLKDKFDQDFSQIKEELEYFQTEAKAKELEYKKLNNQLQSKQSKLDQSQHQIHQLQNDLTLSKQQLDQSQWDAQKYQFQLHQTQEELEQSELERHQLHNNLQQVESQSRQWENKFYQTEFNLSQLQKKLAQTQKKWERTLTQLHQVQPQLEQAKIELSQFHQTEKQLQESQIQLHQTQKKSERTLAQLNQIQPKLEKSQIQQHQTEELLQQSQTQLHQTEELLQQSQTQLHQTEILLQKSQSQLHVTEALLQNDQTQFHQTEQELEQTRTQLHHALQEIERLRLYESVTQPDVEQTDEMRYQIKIWEAWCAYQNGDLQQMGQLLKQSLEYTALSKAAIVTNWLETFMQNAHHQGLSLDTYALTNSPEWKQLVRRSVVIPSVRLS